MARKTKCADPSPSGIESSDDQSASVAPFRFGWQAVSKFNTVTQRHEAVVRVVSDLPFCIDQVKAIRTSDGRTPEFTGHLRYSQLPFDRFPPEIKNMIYSYVFEDLPKLLRMTIPNSVGKPRPQIMTGFLKSKAGSLLYVNRTISREARSWLYSSKTFVFPWQLICESFLEAIGAQNRAHIRNLVIERFGPANKGSFERVLHFLQDARDLECITLGGGGDAGSLVRTIQLTPRSRSAAPEPSIKQRLVLFLDQLAQRRGLKSVEDVLQFEVVPQWWSVTATAKTAEVKPDPNLIKLRGEIYDLVEVSTSISSRSRPSNQFF